MIEETLYEYLKEALAPTAVYLAVPTPHAETYVFLEKTGSGRHNRLDSATFAFQSVAPTLEGAAELNEEVKAKMDDSVTRPEIVRARLNSDYNFTDRDLMSDNRRKEYRYQAVYDIVYYRQQAAGSRQ